MVDPDSVRITQLSEGPDIVAYVNHDEGFVVFNVSDEADSRQIEALLADIRGMGYTASRNHGWDMDTARTFMEMFNPTTPTRDL
jgi:hypothetical protein